ncbi:MAG: hypothetical protein C5B51_27680 [Terriglobia bacterium]|nr:MAG: hypothetical protein C5B51_27680 [Terriglobia bacterium]
MMRKALMLLAALLNGNAADLWTTRVPAKTASLTNPYSGQDGAVMAGAKLYGLHCAPCHGRDRIGSSHVPAITAEKTAGFTEGELFWVLTNGRLKDGMPSWSHLPPQQRWQIIAFLRQ